MITVEMKPSKHLKTKESLFVSFPYDVETVSKIKTLPKRFYVSETKQWEIPVANINDVVTMFADKEIQIVGKVNSKVDTAVSNMVRFDNVAANDYSFKTNPFQHQVEGFNYGLVHNKFLLGDEQGLGKTKQAIDIAVARKSQFKHTLIVCGVNGLKWNWLNEIKVHSNEKGYILGSYLDSKNKLQVGSMKDRLDDLESDLEEYFLITNIETLRYSMKVKKGNKTETVYPIQDKLEELCTNGTIGMVIIDEIHKCKNPTSEQGKAIHSLKAYYKMALTGTPLMNQPIDLYNILKLLDVERHNFHAFKQHYCVMGGFGGYEIVGYKNLNELHNLLSQNMLRRKKVDVLDLPEKIRTTEYVEMTPKQSVIYKEVKEAILANIDEVKVSPNPLAQLIRLRQATGYTGILSSRIQESAKLERMEELVEELVDNGQKCIVFSNWEDMTSVVKERLAKYNPAYVTGKTKDRQGEVDRFQNDTSCKVIIGTIGAMGTGLTLTAASTVIFLDSPWNKANKDQAEDRAHRIGTTSNVNIVTIVCRNTIDERIEEIVELKGDMSDALVDGDFSKLDRGKLVEFLLS